MGERSPVMGVRSPSFENRLKSSISSRSSGNGISGNRNYVVEQLHIGNVGGHSPGGGGMLRAPEPSEDSYSEEEEASVPAPSFSLQAPSGDDSDSSDGNSVAVHRTWRRPSFGTSLRPVEAIEIALAEATARFDQQLQINAQRRVSGLQRSLLEIDAQEQAATAEAAQQRRRESLALSSADAERAARRSESRDQLLSSLRSVHAAEADKAAQKVAELEAAAQEEAERQQRAKKEAEEKAAAAAKAKAELDDKAVAKATQQEEAAKKEQLVAQAAAATPVIASSALPSDAGGSNKHGILSIAPGAAELYQLCAESFLKADALVRPFVEDRAMHDVKRSIDKFVTLNVQQISATLEQVRLKAHALSGFIGKHSGVQRTYVLLTLASKLLSQCEVQITRLHSFAFPLAEVATAVAAAHPDFVDILLARLHAACPLSTPRYYGFRPGGDDLEYLRLMRYKITEEEGERGQPATLEKESTDEYVGRMQGYVMLYAAITQSDNPANPHGLSHAWAYLARLLNALPPNRQTAAALDAFLKVAGYKLAATYRGQFTKLLVAVERDFLAALAEQGDPDARAVGTRLQTFLRLRQYTTPPEGRNMPEYETSRHDRA